MIKTLALLALFLFVLPVQANVQTHKTMKTTKGDQPSPSAAPIVQQQTDSPTLKPEHKEHVDADVRVVSTPAKDGYDKAAFWVNMALAGVGIGGVVVGICTVLFIKAQVIEMRRQRITMDRSLVALRKQIQGAEGTAKRELRAYMNYRQGRIFVENGQVSRISVEIENTGQTPANAVQGKFVHGFGLKPSMQLAKRASSLAVVGSRKSFNIVIPPGGLDQAAILRLTKGEDMFYVAGVVTYEDIFREKRTLRFQIGLGGGRDPVILEREGEKTFYRFFTDAEGNDAD